LSIASVDVTQTFQGERKVLFEKKLKKLAYNHNIIYNKKSKHLSFIES